MKRFVALALLVSACGPFGPPAPVKQGMNEQQVIEALSNRPPDRVIERTCGNATASPFSCKIYVYDGSWRDGYPRLSIVFEKAGGRWLVSQWL